MLEAKNGRLLLDGESGGMRYVRFGAGERTLVVIPGVGDGLKTVRGMALPFALMYRGLAKEFTVYLFSRRDDLRPDTGTREMAKDLNRALDLLGVEKTSVVGVSQGGMIAEWLALDHPDKIEKLVPVVTLCRPNPTVRDVIARWLEMAERGDYRGILIDTAERSYSPRYLNKVRASFGVLGSFGKPKSFERFVIQAKSCLTHDTYGELPRISCPTLVIGGSDDKIVTAEASREIADRIPGSELFLYDGLGHGLYEEAPDFWERVAAFCR